MALRDFHSVSEPYSQPAAAEPLVPACDLLESLDQGPSQSIPPLVETLVKPEADSVVTANQRLALSMQQARQQLQELLLQTPQTAKLFTTQIFDVSDDDMDYASGGIVQDNHFVQPDIKSTGFILLPPDLISVADKLQHLAILDPYDQNRLIECRRRLYETRQQMITANTGLVAFVASRYKTTSLSFDDLMQEGIVGLIKAVDRFDPSRNIRFSTYAIFWIKQATSRLIVKQEKIVRLPIALAEKAPLVFETMRSWYLEHDRWPSLPDLQARCNLAPEDINIISNYYRATHSLDASLSGEDGDLTLMSTLKQQQFPLPLNELIDNNLSLYLSNAVASLSEKEATILNMRFGLRNQTEMTLQTVADHLHVTRERVRQIQNQALKKLKQQFGYELWPFLEPNDG